MKKIKNKLAELEDLINDYRERYDDNNKISETHRLISEAITLLGRD